MSYMSLARKYRPRRFDDMVGQESSALALSNAIKLGREPHSVLFTGVRGVGKTTIARIYAKALNCEVGPTVDPCGECSSCLAIQEGNHEDVLEIDGASNTGIDDIRALQETLGYVPQRSKYKVYIIDEVHMLSTSAFNALLKTLEEPPEHVVFVFATTELNKVPETIQSRCQTFHLKKITKDTIFKRLSFILHREQIPFDETALNLLAKEGRGSLRDALTALDQAIALGAGQVTDASLLSAFGQTDDSLVMEMLSALLKKDASLILQKIADWDQSGRTMSRLVESLVKICRNAMILRELKEEELSINLLDLEERERSSLHSIASRAETLDLNRLFRTWMKCVDDLRHADLDRYIVENYALEWCLDPGLPDYASLVHALNSGQNISVTSHTQVMPQASVNEVSSNVRAKEAHSPSVSQMTIPLKDRWKRQTSIEVPVKSDPISEDALKLVSLGEGSKTNAKNLDHTEIPLEDALGSINRAESIPLSQEVSTKLSGPSPVTSLLTKKSEFPSTWRELVDEWRKQKPLQARVLEETFVVSFGTDRIVLAVDPETMAGSKLLQAEARKKVQIQLEQMFGFTGIVEIQPKASTATQLEQTTPGEALGESLLQTKQREKEAARSVMRQQIQEHPITKELISQFGGTIESIELP